MAKFFFSPTALGHPAFDPWRNTGIMGYDSPRHMLLTVVFLDLVSRKAFWKARYTRCDCG